MQPGGSLPWWEPFIHRRPLVPVWEADPVDGVCVPGLHEAFPLLWFSLCTLTHISRVRALQLTGLKEVI